MKKMCGGSGFFFRLLRRAEKKKRLFVAVGVTLSSVGGFVVAVAPYETPCGPHARQKKIGFATTQRCVG